VRLDAPAAARTALEPYIRSVEAETRSTIVFGVVVPSANTVAVELDSGAVTIGLAGRAVAP
jgi:hypothetical protein